VIWKGLILQDLAKSKFLNSYVYYPTSFGFESKVIMDLNDLGHV
jgi:hypothetical protein